MTQRLVPWASVLEPFAQIARYAPGRPFITEVSGSRRGQTSTYGVVYAAVRRRAAALGALGIGPGVRLGSRPRNTVDAFVTFLATLWIGATAVVADPSDADARVGEQFAHYDVTDWVSLVDDVRRLETTGCADSGQPQVRPDDVAVIVFTSGSTGAPRAVAQSHYNIAVNCAAVARHHSLGPGVSSFACLPISHVNALAFTGLATMAAGGHVFMVDGFDPLTYLASLAASGAQIASVVPSILTTLLASSRPAPALPAMWYFVSAAATLAADVVRHVDERLAVRIVQGYGLSEAVNFSCLMPPRLTRAAYRRLMIDSNVPAVGPALVGNEVSVLASGGGPAQPGEIGEVAIRGHDVMLGYVDDRVSTAEMMRGGWLHTGDLGTMERDEAVGGPVLLITGRAKNVLKIAGHTVGMEEVERALLSVAEIDAAAACGIPDRHSGEALAVLIVSSSTQLDGAAVRDALLRRLGPNHVPRTIRFVPALPLLPNGKLARTELPSLLAP